MKVCPKCGLEYDDDCMFCNKCGSQLNVETKKGYCQYCGKSIDEDSDFCPFCGKILNEDNDLEKVVTQESEVKETVVSSNNVTSVSSVHSYALKEAKEMTSREETTFVSWIKYIVYLAGMLFLWVIFKFFIKLGVNLWRTNGSISSVIISFFVACCILYIMFYRNKD